MAAFITAVSRRLLGSSVCSALTPPVTPKRALKIEQLSRSRVDEYAWLKDPNWKQVWRDPSTLNREIKTYLEKENAYTAEVLAPTRKLQETLFEEMKTLATEDENGPPLPDGEWTYYERFAPGAQHKSYFRRRIDGGDEELLLDGAARAKGRDYFNIADVTHSPNHRYFAWAEDEYGSERFHLYIKDLRNGEILANPAQDAFGPFVFSPDSEWVYWIWRDEFSRPTKVFRRAVRESDDVEIFAPKETDYLMTISHTRSYSHVMIRRWNAESSEVRLIDGRHPTERPRIVEPLTKGLVYSVEEWRGKFVIMTNADGATDFKLMWADAENPSRATWREWVPYRPGRLLIDMFPFADYFVRMERSDANPQFFITDEETERQVKFEDAGYSAEFVRDQAFKMKELRYTYQSPRQPKQWIAYDMGSGNQSVLKTEYSGAAYDKSRYIVERVLARADDGAQIPVTVLRKRDTPLNGTAPLLLYGYGSYGFSIEDEFLGPAISLVDRGWLYAIAHVRGGSEKGWDWFLQARRLHKKRTFEDFIASAEHLLKTRYCGKIVIHGLSAGGLLVGASTNMRPDLWTGVIAQAPFVDMLNTMSDATHPLVPLTRPDWGDPLVDPQAYDYIASYSPYENVHKTAYPVVLATTSVADDRVGYWEPAKWIAKLREYDTSKNPKLLHAEIEGGHGGAAGRIAGLRQMALFYGFAIWAVERNCGSPITNVHKESGR